ncbi:MAG: chemotaxis protein CheW [Candidatus Omnitrophota bacterium]
MFKKEEIKLKSKEIQLVIFRLRDEEFGADISSVLEISRMLDITHIPEAPGFIEGVINLRGQVIAVVDLSRKFGLKEEKELPKTARIVIVEVGPETVGLIVDEVPEVLRIAEENIESAPEIIQTEIKRDYIKGVGKLGERLVILLDLNKVLAPHEIEQVSRIATTDERRETRDDGRKTTDEENK